jgi:hypothetical protein
MKTRIVHTRFWQDEFVNTLTPKEKLLFIYLLTNDRVSLTGMYELPDKYIKADLELTDKELEVAKEKLQKNNKILFCDGWVKIVNHDKYNSYTGEPIQKAKLKELALVPDKLIHYRYPINTSIDTSIDTPNKDIYNHKSKLIIKKDNQKKEVIELTELLFNLVSKNYPFMKSKEIKQENYDDIEKLNRVDGYSFDIIKAVIDWSQQDDFWKQNIRSTKKLREKFETLLVKVSGKLNERKVVNFDN